MTPNKWRAVVFAATLLSLSAGLLMKSPCLYRDWGPPRYIQYRTLCYSDLQPLYGLRGLDQRRIPYVEEKSYEYPALIGLEMWVASYFSNSHTSFFIANVPFLAGSALVASWALLEAVKTRPRRVLYFALAPPLAFYSFHNWDLLAVAPLALCAWAWSRGKTLSTGTFAGLGAAAKLFPAYGLPAFAIDLFWRRRGMRKVAEVAIGAAGAWAVVNIPFIVLEVLRDGSINGWIGVFAFHARRFPDFGTVWYWWPEWMSAPTHRHLAARMIPPVVWILAVAILAVPTGVLYRRKKVPKTTLFTLATLGIAGLLAIVGLGNTQAVTDGPTSAGYKQLVDISSFALFVLGSCALLLHQQRRGRGPWATFGALVTLFLLVSKVHSPQYALWMLVFFVVVETPWPLVAAYFASDAVLLASGFWWFADSPTLGPSGWRAVFIVSVLARALALASLLIWYSVAAKDLVEFSPATSNVESEMKLAAGSRRARRARHWTEVTT
jgi:hypothetical protein